MLFNSVEYLIFFPTVVLVYFLLPYRHRWMLLLVSSYYFYMAWKPIYIVLIVFSTIISYYYSLKISNSKSQKKKKVYLWTSLFFNLSVLFVFKYFNFFNHTTQEIFNHFGINFYLPDFRLLLPMGISFYTFQTLSYTIDVYRGTTKAESHLGIYALFVTFFPQLVAGPIERSDNLLPQFREKHDFDYDNAVEGLILIAIGMFKKVVIADRLAILVNNVYNNVESFSGMSLIIATVFFTFQIYCDFSGYSQIAIGSAKLMGFRLMENFKRPYLAKSIGEFWDRWHISLSTWFRDYVYIPLGGNRVSKPRHYFNLVFTFLVSGLWHGANYTFLTWGLVHGLLSAISNLTAKMRFRFKKVFRMDRFNFILNPLRVLYMFLVANLTWVLFRANSLQDAKYVFSNLFKGDFTNFFETGISLGLDEYQFTIALITIGLLIVIQILEEFKGDLYKLIRKSNFLLRWLFYIGISISIVIFGVFGSAEFIYFQF